MREVFSIDDVIVSWIMLYYAQLILIPLYFGAFCSVDYIAYLVQFDTTRLLRPQVAPVSFIG